MWTTWLIKPNYFVKLNRTFDEFNLTLSSYICIMIPCMNDQNQTVSTAMTFVLNFFLPYEMDGQIKGWTGSFCWNLSTKIKGTIIHSKTIFIIAWFLIKYFVHDYNCIYNFVTASGRVSFNFFFLLFNLNNIYLGDNS